MAPDAAGEVALEAADGFVGARLTCADVESAAEPYPGIVRSGCRGVIGERHVVSEPFELGDEASGFGGRGRRR